MNIRSRYGQMVRARVSTLCLTLLCVLMLSGCGSSKRASARGEGNYRPSADRVEPAKQNPPVDYSAEETDGMGRDLVDEARSWLGTPYRYGGQDRSGTDCSGLVLEIYRNVCGTRLPRSTSDQMAYCTEMARNKARVGDLVFFGSGKSASAISHVGLYIGRGEMIHASSSRGVMVSNIDSGYWGDRFQGVGRVEGAFLAWSESKGKKSAAPAVPDAVSPVPVAVAEVAFNKLPAEGVRVADGNKGETPDREVGTPDKAEASIDLLDSIITQKVDSIFANQFMD